MNSFRLQRYNFFLIYASLTEDIVLSFGRFIVVHEQVFDALAIRLVEAFGG
jgi:hypothetical protein